MQALISARLKSYYPTDEMREVAINHPRVGLGIFGLHNWLIKRGYNYEWNNELEEWFSTIFNLARFYGKYWTDSYGIPELEGHISQAPTGSISLLNNGVSSGIEPIFSLAHKRKYTLNGKYQEHITVDNNVYDFMAKGIDVHNIEDAYSISRSPDGLKRRIEMQVMIQQYTDNAISSTINMPEWGTEYNNEQTLEKYKAIILAYMPYLRGLTIYSDGSRSGQPLTAIPLEEALNTLHSKDSQYAQCANGICGN